MFETTAEETMIRDFVKQVAKRYGRDYWLAKAGAFTEVDEVVEPGELNPECIVTPGVYVQRLVVRPREPRPWDEAI